MKKTGFLQVSFLVDLLSSVYNFFKSSFVMCAWKKWKMTSETLKMKHKTNNMNMIGHNSQVHQWSLKIKIYMVYL